MLLKMGKKLPETCWADSKINKIVIVASSWSFILFTYIFHLLYVLLRHDVNLNCHITYWTFFYLTTHILDPVTVCSKCRCKPDNCICSTWTNYRQLWCRFSEISVLWHLDLFIQEAVLFRPEKLPILLWCDTVSLSIWFITFWDNTTVPSSTHEDDTTVLSQCQDPHTQWCCIILE